MNKSPLLSFAGKWNWSNDSKIGVVPFYDQIKLGVSQKNGLVLGGWSWAGWDNKIINTINIAILTQNDDGSLRLNTSDYIDNSITNGQGSVVVADLNGDGYDDIFLGAHNESPLINTSSTVYLSKGANHFDKFNLADNTQSHSATLGIMDGHWVISVAGYGSEGDPLYQWDTKTNSIKLLSWGNTYKGNLYGSSSVVSDFNGDGKSELVIVDFKWGPGYETRGQEATLALYELSGMNLVGNPRIISRPYFNGKSEYSSFKSAFDDKTHNYRIWAEDFNNDGKIDLINAAGIWSPQDGWTISKLQMLQNKGGFEFTDKTDLLSQAYDGDKSFIDYSMQFVETDKSGIHSYLLANDNGFNGKQGNYFLLNDGTGKLYVALHNEFLNWSDSIINYLYDNKLYDPKGSTLSVKFIPYQLSDNSINYLGSIAGNLVNFPLSYNPNFDYKKSINIIDRNESKNIRTFAGDDSLNEINRGGETTINLGLGLDTVSYSGSYKSYEINNKTNEIIIRKINSPLLIDYLQQVERIRFSDQSLALDISGNAGTTAKILGAVFGKDSITNKNYVGIGLSLLDAGWSYDNLAGLALDAVGAKTNDQIVSLLWTNVIGFKPTSADKQPFIAMLENGMSAGALAHLAADTSFNTTNINLVGLAQTGIEYIPVS